MQLTITEICISLQFSCCVCGGGGGGVVQSTDNEKIPDRNYIYVHAKDFTMSEHLLQAIREAFVPQKVNKKQTIGFHMFTHTQHL
jgi:hypothetical protein